MSDRLILEEYLRREQAKLNLQPTIRAIRAELFDKQLAFWDDPSTQKAALCTRRAGKTSLWARYCTATALQTPRGIVRIWGPTRLRTKELLWDEFKLLFARHKIKVTPNETELRLRFDNGAEIRLVGADKDRDIEKKRGDKTIMEVILESQLCGVHLRKLVEDVAGPCLFDAAASGTGQAGIFCMEGTPGLICAGYWFHVTGNENTKSRWESVGDKEGVGAGWSVHHWSVLDNPFLPGAREELRKLKAKKRWTDESPTYVREWLGRWVNDWGALYYKFDPTRNTYDSKTIKPWGPGWEHVLGWDLGFKDDMALVVWGYHPDYPTLFEAFSWKKKGALSKEVIQQIQTLEEIGVAGQAFKIVKKVADTGGGGKMYVEDVQARLGMVFEAAKKTEKYEHVRLLNDDLAGGFVQLSPGSELAQEMSELPKDPEWPPEDKPEAPPREDPRFPNHCCDAALYAWRAAWHYLHTEEEPKIKHGSPGWFALETKKMEDAVLAQEKRLRENNPEDEIDYYIGEDDFDIADFGRN